MDFKIIKKNKVITSQKMEQITQSAHQDLNMI